MCCVPSRRSLRLLCGQAHYRLARALLGQCKNARGTRKEDRHLQVAPPPGSCPPTVYPRQLPPDSCLPTVACRPQNCSAAEQSNVEQVQALVTELCHSIGRDPQRFDCWALGTCPPAVCVHQGPRLVAERSCAAEPGGDSAPADLAARPADARFAVRSLAAASVQHVPVLCSVTQTPVRLLSDAPHTALSGKTKELLAR